MAIKVYGSQLNKTQRLSSKKAKRRMPPVVWDAHRYALPKRPKHSHNAPRKGQGTAASQPARDALASMRPRRL